MATGSGSSSLQGFSVATLEKRLRELNSTLQSIQSVSQWLIHYRKNAKTVVSIWYKEIQKGSLKLLIIGSSTRFMCSSVYCRVRLV